MLRALARIDLAAIERNAAVLARAAAPAALCAVVKADGYGHGAAPAARAALAGGARWLAVATADEAAAKSKAIVVLKGDDTLVATPNGNVAVSRGFAPALATAGTGDVLSGVIGAMLAKGLAPAHAVCAGVYAHLRAGQIAAAPDGPDGVIASDVIRALPAALGS